MRRQISKFVLVAVVLAGAAMVPAQRAEACWGWRWWRPVVWYTPCYWGCWSPCVWDCCSVCGYYDCCCYSTVTYVTCCDPVVVRSAVQEPTPAPPEAAPVEQPAPETPLPSPEGSGGSTSLARPDAALLTIEVPAEARVFINGLETKSTGPVRKYVSYGLKPGKVYKYQIRAVWNDGERPVEQVKVVYVTGGESRPLAFEWQATAGPRLVQAR